MFDSGESMKISEKENPLSPDISKVGSNGVYTVAYLFKWIPSVTRLKFLDRLQGSRSPDGRVYREGMSLFEELKSAETNSHLSPTDLRTDVVEKEVDTFTNNFEAGKKDPALDLMQESPASTQGKPWRLMQPLDTIPPLRSNSGESLSPGGPGLMWSQIMTQEQHKHPPHRHHSHQWTHLHLTYGTLWTVLEILDICIRGQYHWTRDCRMRRRITDYRVHCGQGRSDASTAGPRLATTMAGQNLNRSRPPVCL